MAIPIEIDKNLLDEYDAPLNGDQVSRNNTNNLKNIKSLKAIVENREQRIYEYSKVDYLGRFRIFYVFNSKLCYKKIKSNELISYL